MLIQTVLVDVAQAYVLLSRAFSNIPKALIVNNLGLVLLPEVTGMRLLIGPVELCSFSYNIAPDGVRLPMCRIVL